MKINSKLGVVAAALIGFVCASPVAMAAEADPEKLFAKAMKDRKDGRYEQAIKGFQSILSNNPRLNRARLELAVAYFHALNFSAATREAEKVLNDPTTPKAVKKKIKLFLARIKLASPKSTWTRIASLGYMYDTNVNVGPDAGSVAPGLLQQSAFKVGDDAILIHVGASHRYISGRNVNIGGRSAAFLWLTQIDYYRNDYMTQHDSDLDVLSLSTGPNYIAAKHWRTGISLQVDAIGLGGDYYGLFTSLNPHFTLVRNNQKTEVTFEFQYQQRDYKRAVDNGRDSTYSAFGISVGQLYQNDKFSLQGGVRVFNEDADLASFSNDGNELFLGMSWRKSQYTTIYGRVARRVSKYDAVQSGLTFARDETQYRAVLGLNHTFPEGNWKGWTFRGSLTFTDNRSNEAVYDYDRLQTAFIMEKKFK